MRNKSFFMYCFWVIAALACTPKTITVPKLAEATVIVPSDMWSGVTANRHTKKTGYQFTVDSVRYKFWGDLDYDITPVYGEKFVITYDSLHPGWWEFDEHQCGPFFYPDEKVDTTMGWVYYSTLVANKKVKMFWYMYHVKDSSFRKHVYCSEAALHKDVVQGAKFPVIYDPNNRGRAKMLFEPAGTTRKLPERK